MLDFDDFTIEPTTPPCDHCDGTGTREVSIGGDGYGGRCCGTADVEIECPFCDGTGRETPS